MPEKIKFAIIGASGVAPGHIKAIQNNPNAELVYFYSRDRERSKNFAKQYGLIAAATYEQILSDKNIDAVDIVTEPSRHAELALMAIQNKKHVLIEKPLETDMLKAQELVTESSKVSTITSVISQKRFEPAIKTMKRQLDNRISGDIFLAEVKMFWHRTSDYYTKGNCWRSQEGNVLINQAIHWIDIAIWFFGFPLKIKSLNLKVKKEISCYDTAICCLEMPNNVLFNLACSTAVSQSQPDEFIIYGTKGILDYGLLKSYSLAARFPYLDKMIHLLKPAKAPLECQIDDFIDSIIKRKAPSVSCLEALNALKVIKSCEKNNGE